MSCAKTRQAKIQSELTKILAIEKSDAVLSDEDLTQMIKDKGLWLTRDALARLRKSWAIPNSYERRHILFEKEFKARKGKRK